MLTLLAAALLVPPPVPGDDRTAILYSVNALLDGLTSGNRSAVEALLESEGSFVAVDSRNAGPPRQRTSSFAQILQSLKPGGSLLVEKIGVPTIMQRADIAHVWAPYASFANGNPTHCGIDSFSLVRRGGTWRISSVTYTVEPLDRCAELAAPSLSR